MATATEPGPGVPQFPLARLLLALLIVFSLFPIAWILLTSMKSHLDIFAIPPRFFVKPNLAAYVKFLGTGSESILRLLWNSTIIAIVTTLATLVIASLAAYAFSRYTFKGWKALLFLVLATRLLPPITAIVPLYLAFRRFHLLDTHLALILVYTALNIPFATWLMKAFFDGIPRELEEAAAIDGCGVFHTLLKVTVPLASSGFAATSIFVFLLAWNEFMFAFMLTNLHARTMPVRIAETIGEMQIFWQDMASLATLIMLPALIVGFFMQRYLVRALTAGAVQ